MSLSERAKKYLSFRGVTFLWSKAILVQGKKTYKQYLFVSVQKDCIEMFKNQIGEKFSFVSDVEKTLIVFRVRSLRLVECWVFKLAPTKI
ncbi:MAG: hypothetical protein R3B39_01710 [Candidatus Paceibacterota bacterium]